MTPTECKEYLFRTGWKVLADMYDWPEGKARKCVGKLRKRGGDKLAVRAVGSIQARMPSDPMAWGMAVIREEHARVAARNKPGFRPPANLPPQVPLEERVDPERFAELRRQLEEM